MPRDLATLNTNILALDEQIRSFEESLMKAKLLRKKLEIEKAELALSQAEADDSESEYEEIEEEVEVTDSEADDSNAGDPETLALQKKIEALKQQLGEAKGTIASRSQEDEENQNNVLKEQMQVMKEKVSWSKPSWTSQQGSPVAVQSSQAPQEDEPTSVAPDPSPPPKKYGFAKPDWAAQSSASSPEESGILTSPITNSLLRQAGTGYQRKIKPTQSIDFVQGQHLGTKLKNTPEPRLAWVVLNVNDKKIGKIVVHLHGRSVKDIVDNFLDLKGASIERRPSRPLRVLDRSPKFFITTNKPEKLENKPDVYGVVQEGHDVLQEVREAPEDASIVIRQAHIYPVKKAR